MDNNGCCKTLEKVWYFGFGSNMKSCVMRSRGIELLDIKAVRVPNYVLTFDVFGLPYSEPAMASIAKYVIDDEYKQSLPNPPDVHGLAYLLSRSDLQRLIGSEGGGVAYKEITVTGVPLSDDSKHISMCTLIAKYPRRPNAAPSRRYLTLLREGAEEHGLPQKYREYLENLPHFTPGTTWLNQLGATTFLGPGKRIVRTLAKRVKQATNTNGECLTWYGALIYYVYTSMWLWHDYVHAPIFGRGDGGPIQYGSLKLLK